MDSHTPSDLLVETHRLTKRFGVRAAIDGVAVVLAYEGGLVAPGEDGADIR
jgi:hypothetical protein